MGALPELSDPVIHGWLAFQGLLIVVAILLFIALWIRDHV